ncbi:MAG: diguanylate cyclase [Burkholderiales bacterium]
MQFPLLNYTIVLFCILLVAGTWGMTIRQVRIDRENAIASTMRQNSNLALAFEEQTVRTLKGVDQIALIVRRAWAVRGRELDLARLITDLQVDTGIIRILSIVDERGDIVLSSRNIGAVNYADREHFRHHKLTDRDTLYVSVPVLGRVSGTWQIPMTRRIAKADGSFGGTVTLSIDPNHFTEFYRKAELGPLSIFSLVGTDGITRARRVGPKGSFGEDIRHTMLMQEQKKRPSGSYVGPGGLDGVTRIFSYRTLPDYALIATVGTAESEALAPFRQRERAYLAAAALASVFILAFAAVLLAGLSRQRKAVDALADSEARFRATFDQATIGISRNGLDGRYLQANDTLCRMLGYSEQELLSCQEADIVHPEDLHRWREDRSDRLASEPGHQQQPGVECRYMRKDGKTIWVLVSISPVRDAAGTPLYFSSVVQDITERKLLQDRISRMAHYDDLTQLPNRALLYDRLKQALAQAPRGGWKVGVLFVDLDRFKHVNDTLGHAYGDRLLKEVSARLQSCMRAGDTVGRIGGDEFAVILSGLADAGPCGLVAEKVVRELEKPFTLDDHVVHVTASVGIAIHPADGNDVDTLVMHADSAMFHAKEHGKNGFEFYTRQMDGEGARRA